MLYIIRHGQTNWNVKYKLQGRTDIPLNEEGRRMAQKAAEEYKDIHFDICYCSPLIRAKETAQILLKDRNIPIIEDDRLMEMCFGDYEGMEKGPEMEKCPINVLFTNPEKYTTSSGNAETFEELFARTGEFLKEKVYPQLEQEKDILIVGHGAMNCSIISQVNNLPREKFWSAGIENCKLKKL